MRTSTLDKTYKKYRDLYELHFYERGSKNSCVVIPAGFDKELRYKNRNLKCIHKMITCEYEHEFPPVVEIYFWNKKRKKRVHKTSKM